VLRRSPEKSLALFQIADDWSREIQPARSSDELLNELVTAWWRGELQAASGPTRLKVLSALFKTSRSEIPFWVDGEDAPQTSWELPDGGVEVLIIPVLPVPSSDPEAWTDEACAVAYEALAEHWRDSSFNLVSPLVTGGISVFEPSFTQWIAACGHTPPEFWRRQQPHSINPAPVPAPASVPAVGSDVSTPPKLPPRKRGPFPATLVRVKNGMYDEVRSGTINIEQLMSLKEVSLAAQYGVSRDTIRRAKKAISIEIVEDTNLD